MYIHKHMNSYCGVEHDGATAIPKDFFNRSDFKAIKNKKAYF